MTISVLTTGFNSRQLRIGSQQTSLHVSLHGVRVGYRKSAEPLLLRERSERFGGEASFLESRRQNKRISKRVSCSLPGRQAGRQSGRQAGRQAGGIQLMIAVYRNVLHDFNDKLQSTRHHPRHRKPVFRAIGFFYPPRTEPSIRRANDAYRSRAQNAQIAKNLRGDNEMRSRRLTVARDRFVVLLCVVERLLKTDFQMREREIE